MHAVGHSDATMKFCDNCDNMLYIRLEDADADKKLMQYCKNCGHEEATATCVFGNATGTQKRVVHRTRDIVHDPTLPRVRHIRCPNADCKGAKSKGLGEVIYMKVDHANLKFLYYCTGCDTFFEQQSSEQRPPAAAAAEVSGGERSD